MKIYLIVIFTALSFFNLQSTFAEPVLSANVFSALIESKDHSIAARMVDAARLQNSGKENGISIFAPTDKAFEKVSKKFLDGSGDKDEAAIRMKVLNHHGIVTSLKLKDLKNNLKLKLADGTTTILTFKNEKYSIKGVPITAVISTKKGIIFSVDKLLLPWDVKEKQIQK